MSSKSRTRFPTTKLTENLNKLDSNGIGTPLMILIETGSLCPIHLGHVEMMESAKRFAEETLNRTVVSGLLSPSHDYYVSGKLGNAYIKGSRRIELIDLALEDSDWLESSSWEIDQSSFVDFPQVCVCLAEQIAKEFPDHDIKVGFVCGADHGLKTSVLRYGIGGDYENVDVICIGRPGSTKKLAKIKVKAKGVFICEEEVSDVSSTAIRNAIKSGDSLEGMCHPNVIKALLDSE